MQSSLEQKDENLSAGACDALTWRRWLLTFVATVGVLGIGLYAGVVLIDPYSTGRFSPISRIDLASTNVRLLKGGLVRDTQFDAALFGSSTGYPLDPKGLSDRSGWRTAQLAIPASLPPTQLVVARAYQRFHADRENLQIYILDRLWCRPGDPMADPFGAFPNWIYESSQAEYLSRIFFPDGVKTAFRRIGIWIGFVKPVAREDGFMVTNPAPIPRSKLAAVKRPAAAPADKSFPALDLLAAHIATLPPRVRVAFVFAPPYINTLPIPGSAADARIEDCKRLAQQIIMGRTRSAYLDLMTENAISSDEKNYFDEVHYTPEAADRVVLAVANVLQASNLAK